ncbi:MAG: pseudouridine synthase [Filifactoraceae bacterium]
MRLDKMLSNLGYGSRKDIKQYGKEGRIKLNNITIKDMSTLIDTNIDHVFYLDEKVEYREFIYLMMNKPQNVVSATEDNIHQTVIDILEFEDLAFKPSPVGRLDIDTEGLLLLTNDGKLSHDLLSPKKHIDKTYYVEVEGRLTDADIKTMKKGIYLENERYTTLPAVLEIIYSGENSTCRLTIQEGKFHQVKRMMIAIGKKVTYLKRIQMGSLKLDENLKLGEYRELTEEELKQLKGE